MPVYIALVEARAAHARQAGLTHVGVFAKLEPSSPILGRIGFETPRWQTPIPRIRQGSS